ncbi:MAG: ethanolamine utilization protein EutN [Deltaproteobacteria bacterium GWA2_38_16]|nr:MAG: ethanolamine utilization protein EutN [Deltaproteobacteria bacterium GWA2_38_16]OGQ01886.1 MAG: ethanolamine utilization protein EutN [Deltaproteobacteria bacterium RIFCSPHIGHO2_02_FULL_38_15]OGQ29945.1 MAG: ethanolamine utilization protein EutN [Deltaproteobacteria bacterium RIFCSPLOWO2_01_FULL_38_9]OGQ60024.1 MAG: ethanolamine utilization protein EutN [Deltaproteobacteria bacterium RIFCSPLOWO2_12_FULL_38_8]HBQ20758.1 ethanolamine utilization protein EutN [Deltaproteobacteria bacterium
MQVGRVVGTVVSSQKDPGLSSLKLLVVEQTDLMGKSKGSHVVAIDSVGAGVGELVLYASGSSARQTEITQNKPVDTVIMGIIDTITLKNETVFTKE